MQPLTTDRKCHNKHKIACYDEMQGLTSVAVAVLACWVQFTGLSQANMLSNPGFELGPGSGAAPIDWGTFNKCGQEEWAKETGTNGVAFWGWDSGGGGFYQTGINADTNALYYLRIRGRGEAQFASCDIEVKLEFYQVDETTCVGAHTNIYASSAALIWENYMITSAAVAGAARVRPVISYPDRTPTGWGSQSYQWDNSILYDRTLTYRYDEIVDEFSYDPDYADSLDGKDRGYGFTNSWIESNPGSFNIADSSFSDVDGYPTVRGNEATVEVSGNSAVRTARREFQGMTNGTFYFSSYINFKWGQQNDKWMGLSIMSNSTELAFVGAKGVSNKPGYLNLVLDNFGGSTVDDDYEFHDNNDDYIIIGRYNFATRELAAKAYWAGTSPDTIPYLEPTTWDAVTTIAVGRIKYINGIRIGSGNNASGSTCGPSYWDEVRVASDWHNLLNTSPPSTNWAFDRFNYAANTPLHLASGGGDLGFTDAWQNDNYRFTNRVGDINAPIRYPVPTNNLKVEVRPGYNNLWDIGAYREMNGITNGRIYGAFLMRYEWGGPEKYVAMDFMSNNVPVATFGRVFSTANTNVLGLDTAVPRLESHYELKPAIDGSEDYLIIGCYDFMSRNFRTIAYHCSAKMPPTEPLAENWSANATVDVGRVQYINAIRIKAGGTDPATPGQTYFDEVRIARSWNQLLEVCWKPPEGGADFDVGTIEYLTDADITGGTYNISMKIIDPDGLNTSSNTPGHFTPVFDIQNASGCLLLTNQTWDTMTYADSGQSLFLTSLTHSVAAAPEIDFGTYTIRWSTEDSNNQYVIHGTSLADGSNTTFTVYDDDIVPPVAELLYVGTNYTPGAVSNQVTDGDLAGGSDIDVAVKWFDTNGIWFATNNFANIDSDLGNVQPNWDLTNSLLQDFGLDVIFTNFFGDSTYQSVTSVVYNIASINPADITLSTWGLTVSAQDHDADRSTWVGVNASDVQWDRTILTNQILNFMVVDDDTNAPVKRTHAFGGLGSKFLVVATNNHAVEERSGTSSNTIYTLTDGYMVSLDAVGNLQFSIGALDEHSGIAQGTSGTSNETISFSIDNVITGEDVIACFDGAASSAAGANVVVTNVWTFDDNSVFTPAIINSLISAGTSVVFATIPDSDQDRTADRSVMYSHQVGMLAVCDDDAVGPTNSATPLQVMVDETAVAVLEGSGTGTVFEIQDGQWADADTAPVTFSFNAWDPSGLNRGINAASTNMNVTIDGVATNNVTNYNASASSINTSVSAATNLWTWVTPFGYDTIGDMYADGNSNHPVIANVIDADNDRSNDNMWGLTNRQFGLFRVTDDDTNRPATRTLDNADATWGTGAGSKYMVVATNGTIISDRASDGSSVVYRVTDGYIANLDGGQYLQFAFGAIDDESGIAASAAGADTNEYMSMSIENGFSGNMSAFDAAESSTDAAGVVRTNVFTFDDNTIITDTIVSNLIVSAQSNAVWVTMPDSDADRPNDQIPLYSEQVGYLYVEDDDTEAIHFYDFRYSGKTSPTDGDMTNATFSITGLVEDASGIWGTADATRKPVYSLYSPTAQITVDQDMASDIILDGEGTTITPAPISKGNIPVAYADNTLGIWTVRVTAVDADDDGWTGDSLQTVSNMAFEVIDDDTDIPALSGIRLGSGTGGGADELIFSEYLEVSTGDNKYLEIYNGTADSVDLSEYQIAKYFNGATAPSGVGNPINLAGTLAPGGVFVIADTSSSGWSGTPDMTDNLNFNGNDAIALLHNSTTVDVLGVIGDLNNWGNEVTMVRDIMILNPSELWQTNDWTYYPPNTYDYLGSHLGPITDAELADANLTITGNVQDTYSGIYAVGPDQPVYSIYQPDGTVVAANQLFSQAPFSDGDAISIEPLADDASGYFNYNNIVLGTHTVQVTVVDYDHDRADDHLGTTNTVPLYVIDDDAEAPIIGSFTPVNLLRNASFEGQGSSETNAYYWKYDEPDKMGGIWNNYLRVNWRARSGAWEASIPGQWGDHVSDSGGWYQLVTNAYPEGTIWQASGLFFADLTWTSAVSYLSIQFYDLDTNRIYGATNIFEHPGEAWTNISMQATSPANCVYAKWEVGTWGMSAFGALQFDDVELGPFVSTPMAVQIGNSNVTASGTGTNAVFTVTDGDLAVTQGANLLSNEGFEDSWSYWGSWGAIGLAGWAAENGAMGGYFRAWPDADSAPFSGGFYQDVASPVAGEIYFFTIRGYKEPNFWATEFQQKLEFLDGGYAIVQSYTNIISLDNVSAEWQAYTLSGVAPAGASYVRSTILFNGATNDGAGAGYRWDNAALWAGYDMYAPIQIRLGAYDEGSGLTRGIDDPSTQMNISVSHWITDNVKNFSIMDSQTPTTNIGAVSTWEWYSIDKGTISALYNAGSNAVHADLFDADYDRVSDNLSRTDELFGYLRVIDDDTNGPTAQQLDINWSPANATNYVTDGSLRVGSYGVKITFEDQSGIFTNYLESWMPDFDLIAPNGETGLSSMAFENFNSLTNGTVIEAWKTWGGSVAHTNVTTGVWAITWSAQDDDKDRLDDRSYTSKSGIFNIWTNIFTVYDDDTTAPIAPSNLVASITYWTNINNFSFTWDPAIDDSGIAVDGYRIYTNSTPDIDDGVPMVGTSVTNIITNDVFNGGFEIGDGESGEFVYTDSHGWWNRGSDGTRGQWSNALTEEGTNAMRLSCDAGSRPNGSPRYSLIQTYTPIDNTNNYPGMVELSGYFYGDLSAGANGDYSCAFLKMEFCDANSNVIAVPVANEYDDGFNGRPGYGIDTMGTWSNMSIIATNMPANTKYILASVGLGHNQTYQNCYGYWDHVSLEVSLITPAGTFGAAYTNAAEGSNTVWLYVVDDDQDRVGDQLMSSVTNFTIMFDETAPAQIGNFTANDGPDETTEVELSWDACADAGGTDLSPWRSYRVYYTDEARNPTTNDPYFSSYNSMNATLGTRTTDAVILSNFIFGMEYTFAIAGEDRAGNIGVLSASVPHYFAGFFMTQGVSMASGGQVGWTAHDTMGVVDRPYDLLYQDALHFTALTTNHWTRMETITNSYLIDTDIDDIPSGYTRFYRAAQVDRWQVSCNPRIASAEIYGMRKLTLYPGQNWVQYPFIPDTDTVSFIMGTDLPGGTGPADVNATRISWYEKTDSQHATNEIYFTTDGDWVYSIGGSGYANDKRIPLTEGFLVEIPTNSTTHDIWWMGKVPTTNPVARAITIPANAFSFIACNQPRYMHPSQMGLIEAGFRPSALPFPWPGSMDIITVWDNSTQSGRDIWCDSTGAWRYAFPSPAFPLVPTNALNPNQAFLINTIASPAPISWPNDLIYPVPTREMSP